jgi:hypothetical protein
VPPLCIKALNGSPQPDPSGLDRFLIGQIAQVLAIDRIANQSFVPGHEQVEARHQGLSQIESWSNGGTAMGG